MILYHGSPNRNFIPEYGKGEDKHDYGRGFYLTENVNLAREWAVCDPTGGNGWVHTEKLISRYAVELNGYDVIRGWRANASYFYIAKAFVRDEIDLCILDELFHMGDLGIQYCLKSPKAFLALTEDADSLETVDYNVFNEQYNIRDRNARIAMKELINSEKNKVTDVFSTLL